MKRMMMAAAALSLAGCGTTSGTDNDLVFLMGPDGKMTSVAPRGASEEDVRMANALTQIMNGALDDEEEPERALTENEIWRQDADNHLTHIQSGATCPATWSGLVRERTTIFRPDGMDVGCNYLSPNGPTVMTFYSFTMPGPKETLEEVLKQSAEPLKARQPTAKETPFLAPSQHGQYLAAAVAYTNVDGTKMRTSVLVAEVNGWYLKIRLTCRESDAPVAENTAGLAIMGQADRLRTKPVPKEAKPDPI